MIIERLIVSPLRENCFIVGDEATQTGFIVDPGDEADRIVAAVERLGLTIPAIINTHAHVDHVAAAQTVRERFGAKLHLHPAEKMHLPGMVSTAAMFGIFGARTPTVDSDLADGDQIDIGSLIIKVTHTPGHTPGHCIFRVGDDVFCGDLVFSGSIGRTDLPGGDYAAIIHSLETAILTLPDQTRLHPGHGESTTVAIERQFNPFLRGLRAPPGGSAH